MDYLRAVVNLLRRLGQFIIHRLFGNQNVVEAEISNEDAKQTAGQCPPTDRCEDAGTPPESTHQQAPAHSPHQTPVETSSVSDASESSDAEQQLQTSLGLSASDTAVQIQDDKCAQTPSDIAQQPDVLTTEKEDDLLKHDADFQQNVTTVPTSSDVLPDVSSTTTDPTTKAVEQKDNQSRKSTGDVQSLPVAAVEARKGNRIVRASISKQKDSSDAEENKQNYPSVPLPPEPPSGRGHALSTSGDNQEVRIDRSLATDRMEADQEAEANEDRVESATVQPDSAITSTAPTVESDFYKGRPSFAARIESIPSFDQEHNIIKQLHGRLQVCSPLIIVGDEGCGKTTAALMLARRMTVSEEIDTMYWCDSDHVSSCKFPSTGTSSLLVIDDFLGHCPSESYTRWRSFSKLMALIPATPENKIFIVLTSRTSVLQQFQVWHRAELGFAFFAMQPVTVSMDYRQVWKSSTTGIELKPPNLDRLPSIGFPLCCKLLPCLSQPVRKILFQQPRHALRTAVVELIKLKSVARTALALLAVTDGYLDTSVLLDQAKLQASQYWKPLNSLEKHPVDKSTATAVLSFYEDCQGLILLEDEFASFLNETIRESVLVVLLESHAEFLSEFCSLKLLSQIALVTSDVEDDSDREEKPVLSDCAKTAFLQRMITELESRNYHGVFTCSLLTHASFQKALAEKINHDLMSALHDTRDQNGLHFLFYAGAISSVFEHAVYLLNETDDKMVLQAILACCYWDHAKQIDHLWTNFKKKKALKKSLKTASIERIATCNLSGLSGEKAPQWMTVPIHPEDTLVTMAAWRGNDAVVQNLASKGMNLSSQGKNGWTALMHYCARGNPNMTSFLLRKKADPLVADVSGMTALMFALKRKEWDIPRELINLENCRVRNHRKESPLLLACASGWSLPTITNILSLGDGVIFEDQTRFTCLHYACQYGHAEVTAYLLENTNIDVGQKTDTGYTPLLLALTSPDQLHLVKILLKFQALETSDFIDILTSVCRYSGRKILDLLLSVRTPNDKMKLWALKVACGFGNADVAQYLLHQGVNPHLPIDAKLSTCLHLACDRVSLETVQMVARKMNCNVTMTSGTTPLMIALQHGRLEFVQLLHREGASLNMQDNLGGCVHHAAKSDSIRVLEWCVNEQHMDINHRNKKNQTPLVVASSEGRTRSMKWLLDHGADVAATDKDGNNCLHAAAQSGCLVALKILLNKMSPGGLSVRNHSGKTPLQLAEESGHTHVVDFLTDSESVDFQREKDQALPPR